jgi:hypothetical protein
MNIIIKIIKILYSTLAIPVSIGMFLAFLINPIWYNLKLLSVPALFILAIYVIWNDKECIFIIKNSLCTKLSFTSFPILVLLLMFPPESLHSIINFFQVMFSLPLMVLGIGNWF